MLDDPAMNIELIETHTVQVERQSEGDFANGFYTPGPLETITDILSSVQPTTGEDLDKLPDYARERQTWRFFSQAISFKKTDVVEHDGEKYEILHLEPWDGFGLECVHSYAIGVLVDVKKDNPGVVQ